MQNANRLRNALTKGGASFGVWQMLPGATLSRQLGRTGVDWVCVDGEHGDIDDAQMHLAVMSLASTGVSPVVRIPGKDDWMVKRALDAGAHGIVCPLLKTVQDARDFVAACKFPPKGTRGFGSAFAMEAFRKPDGNPPSLLEYLTQASDTILTIVQIETREALDNVEEIAAIDGLDILFIGPFDLGNNIGKPMLPQMHPELKVAIDRIREAAVKAGKWTGFYASDGAQAQKYADEGFNMVSIVNDSGALQANVVQQFQAAKGGIAHQALKGAQSVASKVTGT